MKRKMLALLLAALLALSGMAALAEAGWTCPDCGAENTHNFCTNCGAARPVAEAGWICPDCGAENTHNFCTNCGAAKPVAEASWTCESCGTVNAAGYAFCVGCGTPKDGGGESAAVDGGGEPATEDGGEAPSGWTCESCGAVNAAEYGFCIACGTPKGGGGESAAVDGGEESAAEDGGISPDGCDARLDAAFAAGAVRFARAEPALPDFDTCALVVPEEGKAALAAQGIEEGMLRTLLLSGELRPVSISPDGTHVVAILTLPDGNSTPVVMTPDQVAMICPTTRRGVEDTYGNLQKTYDSWFQASAARKPMGLGDEGMIWSPSGRYCSVSNIDTLYKYMKLELCNPILIDSQTGEMFLLDTFDRSLFQDGSGASLTGCFSADERYFYSLFYGNGYESICTLLRYDLQTGEKQVMGSLPYGGYPRVAELRDGRLVTIVDQVKREYPQGLAFFQPDGGVDITPLPVSMAAYYANRACYSAESGWMLIRGRCSAFENFGITPLLRIQPDGDASGGLDTGWCLNWAEGTMEPLALDTVLTESGEPNADTLQAVEGRYAYLMDAKLSPDGRYAALAAVKDQEVQIFILRLEDMAVLPAEGVETAFGMTLGALNGGVPVLDWSEAGLLVFGETGSALWQAE